MAYFSEMLMAKRIVSPLNVRLTEEDNPAVALAFVTL